MIFDLIKAHINSEGYSISLNRFKRYLKRILMQKCNSGCGIVHSINKHLKLKVPPTWYYSFNIDSLNQI